MPFTLAHPVAVLPLARSRLSFSALVVGSMAPDFPYFVTFSTRFQFGHSLAGVFAFCLPAGLLVLFLYHQLLKRPILERLPIQARQCFQSSVEPFHFLPLGRFAIICASIILGAITHIVWDSFTHAHGWMVQRIPALQQTVMQFGHSDLKVYKVLQHGSSVIGVALILWYYHRWCSAHRAVPDMI